MRWQMRWPRRVLRFPSQRRLLPQRRLRKRWPRHAARHVFGTPFGGSACGSTGFGTLGDAFFGSPVGPPLGCQPGGLALCGGLFRGGLLYLGSTGCQLGLTLCLLPGGLPLCGTLGGELGLSLGFLSGFLPGSLRGCQPGGLALCGSLLRRFPGGLALCGAPFCEPLRPLGGGPCGGLTLGGSPFGLQIGPRHPGLLDLGDLYLRYRLGLFDGLRRFLDHRRRSRASLRGLPILGCLDRIPELGVEGVQISFGLCLGLVGALSLGDSSLDRSDPLFTLGLEPIPASRQLVSGLADLQELGPLPVEQPNPQIQPGGELGEVVHPDQNIHEGYVPTLVNLRSTLFQSLFGHGESLFCRPEVFRRPGDLPVQLVHLVERIVVGRLCRASLQANLHQTVLGSGDISLLRPDAAVRLGPGRDARYEHERNGKT